MAPIAANKTVFKISSECKFGTTLKKVPQAVPIKGDYWIASASSLMVVIWLTAYSTPPARDEFALTFEFSVSSVKK